MLWVGGHILLVGTDELGWHWPYSVVHDLEENSFLCRPGYEALQQCFELRDLIFIEDHYIRGARIYLALAALHSPNTFEESSHRPRTEEQEALLFHRSYR